MPGGHEVAEYAEGIWQIARGIVALTGAKLEGRFSVTAKVEKVKTDEEH